MRIVVITGVFHPETVGPATYLLHLLDELVRRGHEVRVITCGDANYGHPYPYPVERISVEKALPTRMLSFTWRILRIGRSYDLLFVNDYGLPAALANYILRKPVVLKIVGDAAWERAVLKGWIPPNEGIEEFQRRRGPLRSSLLKRIQQFYAKRADRIIAPSGYLKRLIGGWEVPQEKIVVIHNAVRASNSSTLPSKDEVRTKLALRGKTILTVARLAPWKGVDRIIRIMPRVREAEPRASLVVLGQGPELPRLRALAEELGVTPFVEFRGSVPNERMPLYFKAADVFVLYSGYEGLPHVVLEAMASGTSIVASSRGGTPELLDDGIDGALVEYGDEKCLAERILQLLGNPELASRYGSQAQEKAKRFDWNVMVEKTLALFEDALQRKSKGPD